jgi:hypothetical protein
MTNRTAKNQPGMWLTHRIDATYGSRVFVNMNYRNGPLRSNRLTMWVTPDRYDHDVSGGWRFHAKCGPGATLRDEETIELLAALMVYMAAHGLDPETAPYSAIVALAERPQMHVSPAFVERARKKLAAKQNITRGEHVYAR